MENGFDFRVGKVLPRERVLALYQANHWSSADRPDQLMAALAGSHTVVTAWRGEHLVGLGNAISDGHLVVYYPHLLVHPDWRGQGIGRGILEVLAETYAGFHQQILLADGRAVEFYERCGFEHAGAAAPMWIYEGHDHD